jgi:hypothetical protein
VVGGRAVVVVEAVVVGVGDAGVVVGVILSVVVVAGLLAGSTGTTSTHLPHWVHETALHWDHSHERLNELSRSKTWLRIALRGADDPFQDPSRTIS